MTVMKPPPAPNPNPNPHPNLASGTVYYSMRREVPGVLLRDNPDVKAIFIVRDPVERTASHHRYSFKAFALMVSGDSAISVKTPAIDDQS